MNQINGLYAFQNQAYNAVNQKPGRGDKVKESPEDIRAKAREAKRADSTTKTQDTEVQLSDKAKALLEELKQKYDNIDFFVADYSTDEEAQSYLDRGTKEFSVLLDPETLEAMANDEETKNKYTDMIDEATTKLADMKDQLEESGVEVKSLGVSIADDGSMTLFASIEEMSAKRQEQLEKTREKKAEEQEKAEKDAEKKKADSEDGNQIGRYARPDRPRFPEKVKETTVTATSVEELLDKIQNVDWSQVEAKEKKPPIGGHFDFQM